MFFTLAPLQYCLYYLLVVKGELFYILAVSNNVQVKYTFGRTLNATLITQYLFNCVGLVQQTVLSDHCQPSRNR